MEQQWHVLDADKKYECRQVGEGRYLVRAPGMEVKELTSEEFNRLREPGPSPKGLS